MGLFVSFTYDASNRLGTGVGFSSRVLYRPIPVTEGDIVMLTNDLEELAAREIPAYAGGLVLLGLYPIAD